jgi:hypothetical protein
MDGPEQRRGLLKPENSLRWPGAAPVAKGNAPEPPAAPAPKAKAQAWPPQSPRPKGLPSNAMPQAQYTLEQLKKMAEARGLSVEKLLAQMVQQYLKEE